MMLPSRRNLHALAGVYALDALDDGAEQKRFTRHLRRCQACAEEVRGFQDVAAALAFAAAAEPPPELRDQVMAAVGRTRQLPPVMPRRRLLGWLRWPSQSVWLPRLATATAAIAIAAVVALGIALSGAEQQLSSARAQSQAIAAVLRAPDLKAVSGPVTTGGMATVLLSAGKRELVVAASGLAALPAGKVYELWLIGPSSTQETAVRRAGLLPPALAGLTTPVLASGLVAGDQLAMTVEPAGGTAQPTTTPILQLSLPAGT
jgi:anti-sigma-K factor RskA